MPGQNTPARGELVGTIQDLSKRLYILEHKTVPTVAALPPNPADKQEIYFLVDQANGIVWHLRYRAFQSDGVTPNPSAYKWEWVGGSDVLGLGVSANAMVATVVTYGISSVPNFTAPLAGEYRFSYSVSSYNNTGAAGLDLYYRVRRPPSTIILASSYLTGDWQTAAFQRANPAVAEWSVPITAAGDILEIGYALGQSYSAQYDGQNLAVRPTRVG